MDLHQVLSHHSHSYTYARECIREETISCWSGFRVHVSLLSTPLHNFTHVSDVSYTNDTKMEERVVLQICASVVVGKPPLSKHDWVGREEEVDCDGPLKDLSACMTVNLIELGLGHSRA